MVALHPAAVETYRRQIEALYKGWSDDSEARQEAVNAMRALIARIEIAPGERRGETHVRILGKIEELLGLTQPKLDEACSTVARTASMVAAEGFEPPTKGL